MLHGINYIVRPWDSWWKLTIGQYNADDDGSSRVRCRVTLTEISRTSILFSKRPELGVNRMVLFETATKTIIAFRWPAMVRRKQVVRPYSSNQLLTAPCTVQLSDQEEAKTDFHVFYRPFVRYTAVVKNEVFGNMGKNLNSSRFFPLSFCAVQRPFRFQLGSCDDLVSTLLCWLTVECWLWVSRAWMLDIFF